MAATIKPTGIVSRKAPVIPSLLPASSFSSRREETIFFLPVLLAAAAGVVQERTWYHRPREERSVGDCHGAAQEGAGPDGRWRTRPGCGEAPARGGRRRSLRWLAGAPRVAGEAADAADRARRALVRMSDTRTESISQIGRMVQKLHKVQALMMSKLESLEEKMERKLEKLGDKMEGVSLEVKKLARLHSNRHADQQPRQERATASGSNTNFHLRFLNGLKTPIYTEKKIASKSNSAIRIGIFDGDANMVREGPLLKAKVEMLVLRGDFCNDGRESWTEEEFNSHVAQGRHRQGFVLGGDCSVWLNNGEASFGTVCFKEGSSRTPNRKFVVAARVCINGNTTGRVREAIMKPETVLDRRNEANEKRHPPELDDEVYRLEEISKDGTYRKRPKKAQIFTVQDFLKALNRDANKL